MARSHDLGSRGERLASDTLRRRGWTILDRNFRAGHKEVDLVARRGPIVAFVEVKTRSGIAFGHPLAAVTGSKRKEIRAAARAWIGRNGQPGDRYRFDVVAILVQPGRPPLIEHVEDAWRD